MFIKNFSSLFTLQLANFILPLLTIPYLVRILGAKYYGLIAFATAINSFLILITDYGFNQSASRRVTVNKNDSRELNKIFSIVFSIKLLLLFITFILLFILVFSLPKLKSNWQLYLLTYGFTLGQVLLPIWLFQGLERMQYISYISITIKTFFIFLIFVFVKNRNDYLLIPLLNSISSILIGLFGLFIVLFRFKISYIPINLDEIKIYFIESWYVFSSKISTTVYTILTPVVLGFWTDTSNVGYYSNADKIIQAIKNIYVPFSQALYPYMGSKFNIDKGMAANLLNKIIFYFSFVMLTISILIFLFAKDVVILLFGVDFEYSTNILRILSLVPFLVTLSNLTAIQGLYSLGKFKMVNAYIWKISLLHIFLLPIFISIGKLNGAAILVVWTELLITVMSVFYYYKHLNNEEIIK